MTLLPKPYAITLHHRTGRTVDATVWARDFDEATERAWKHGCFDNWEAVTLTRGGESRRTEAPAEVRGRA